MFTKEELEELAKADAEIDEEFVMTQEEIEASRNRDKEVRYDRMDNRERKIAAGQKAYREANREKIAAGQKAYREANREKIAAGKKAYYEANREKILTGMKNKRKKGTVNECENQCHYQTAGESAV